MAQKTDQDIAQIKTALEANTKAIDSLAKTVSDFSNSFTGLREETRLGFSDLKGEIKTINSRISGLESSAAKIPDLAEKLGELKNWKQIVIVLFTAALSGTITWFIRKGN